MQIKRIIILPMLILLIVPMAFGIGATYFSDGGVESTTANFADTPNMTISFWMQINDSAGDGVAMLLLSDGAGFSTVSRRDSNFARIQSIQDPSGEIVDGTATTRTITSANAQGWVHVLMAISTDFDGDTAFRVYLNDTNQTSLAGGVTAIGTEMNWDSSAGYTIGSNQVGGQPMIACLSEVWIDNTFLDIDDVNVRRNFIGADGGAIEIGGDGSSVTGSQPLIYMTGTNFSINNGSLDDPNVNNGVQTECDPPPESVGAPPVIDTDVNVTIVNPLNGSFQVGLVFVDYTFDITTPQVFDNGTLLVNGTVNQTQETHLNFTVELDDGNYNLTIIVFANSSDSGQDDTMIIVNVPITDVNVTIINPFDGSFQGGLVFVNYTFDITTPQIFDNGTLLVNGTINQTQETHLNFTVDLEDGHYNLTIIVFANSSDSGQDDTMIIVDTINPIDNLNTIIPDGTQIDEHMNYTITATNANLILHNITVYSLSGSQLLSQQDTGALGTTNDITINLDNSFFVSNAPATFNITSLEEDNISLSTQNSILLTIIPPSADALFCNDITCTSLSNGDTLDNITVTCTNISVQSVSVLVAINLSEVINDNTLDVTIGDNFTFFENLNISTGDYNVTGVCFGDNGEDRISSLFTISEVTIEEGTPLSRHFITLAGVAGGGLLVVVIILGVCSALVKEFRRRKK